MLRSYICGVLFCLAWHVTGNGTSEPLTSLGEHGCRQHVYHVIRKTNVTWSEASRVCDLAIIRDDAAVICSYQHLYDHDVQLWTAGIQLDTNWTWITGTPYKGLNISPRSDDNCASISVTGVYNTWPCTHRLTSYMCRLPPATCTETAAWPSSYCYKVHQSVGMCVVLCHDDRQYTWYSARNMCLHGNGDLISFDDVQTTGDVMASVEGRFGSTQHVMWIGLARNLWSWRLHNGTEPITIASWSDGEPTARVTESNHTKCLALESGNGNPIWRSLDCDTALQGALCEGTSFTIPTTVSGTSPTEPADGTGDNATESWIKNDMTILSLSVAGLVVFILLLVIVSLIICLRNARRINILLGTRPKTYFDYFDFRRKLPPMTSSSQSNRTVVLTNDMLTSSAGHHRNEVNDAEQPVALG